MDFRPNLALSHLEERLQVLENVKNKANDESKKPLLGKSPSAVYANILVSAGGILACLALLSSFFAKYAVNQRACYDAQLHGYVFSGILAVCGILWKKTDLSRNANLLGCWSAVGAGLVSWIGVISYASVDVKNGYISPPSMLHQSDDFERGRLTVPMARAVLFASGTQVFVVITLVILIWGMSKRAAEKQRGASGAAILCIGGLLSFALSVLLIAATDILVSLGVVFGVLYGISISLLLRFQPGVSDFTFSLVYCTFATWLIVFTMTTKMV